MTLEPTRIPSLVEDLEREIQQVDRLSDSTKEALRDAIQEIQSALAKESEGADAPTRIQESAEAGWADRLRSSVQDFESSHPTLAAAVERLLNALGQIGI